MSSTSTAASQTYKIYYSSRDKDQKMWCPDCVAVESTLSSVFAITDPTSAAPARPSIPASELPEAAKLRPDADIVYVGDRQTWRDAKNEFRQKPYELTGVPTILKFDGNKVVARIVEDDIFDRTKLGKFLDA